MEKRDARVILETPRLRLRQFTEDDVDNLVALDSDPEVMRYLTGGEPTPPERIRDQVIPFHLAVYERLSGLGTWAAESTTGEFLGWFHFRPGPDGDITNVDLGYRLRRSAWNKGYATEGSRALIAAGFTKLGVERVFAHALTANAASRRVMEKCGLTLVRTVPYEGTYAIEGAEHGEVEYALTKTEWEARTAESTLAAMSPWQAPERARTPRVPDDERSSLESWLEFHRATLLIKCAGLTPEQLVSRSCPPSPLSLLGLVRHMAQVEGWFHRYDGQPSEQLYGSDDNPDADFEDTDPLRADQDLAAYRASVERARAAVTGRGLDELLPKSSRPTSLRWVYQHMIEEYARHNGHADLLRERIDGATGT